MHLEFRHGFSATLVIIVMFMVLGGLTFVFAKLNSPPVIVKPVGLVALESAENRQVDQLLEDMRPQWLRDTADTITPIDPNAPAPRDSRLYNNLLDNLLTSLHYYYRVPEDTPPEDFVTSWRVDDGSRIINNARLLAMESQVSYLLTLVKYHEAHDKVIFQDDLEYVTQRVDDLFNGEWHTVFAWPLGLYFDLMEIYEITGEEKYLQYAERYAFGDGPEDIQTPLQNAANLARNFVVGNPRAFTPFHFYHAALLADYGNRYDPTMLDAAQTLFEGLRQFLYDPRYKLLWKQVSIQTHGSDVGNYTRTFDTLEQLLAVQALCEYHKASGNPEAISLARLVLEGVWGLGSPLLIPPPEGMPEETFFGLYTGYDVERESERMVETEATMNNILLYSAHVMVNEQTRGELRGNVDYLASWLENNGPLYKPEANGYLVVYDENYQVPNEDASVLALASIWMARATASDDYYRYLRAVAMTETTMQPGL